jgi:hypothetical protein
MGLLAGLYLLERINSKGNGHQANGAGQLQKTEVDATKAAANALSRAMIPKVSMAVI